MGSQGGEPPYQILFYFATKILAKCACLSKMKLVAHNLDYPKHLPEENVPLKENLFYIVLQ